MVIGPETCVKIPVNAYFPVKTDSLFVEKTIQQDHNKKGYWGSPDSLIQRDNPFLHVSNFSDQSITIATGQVLARAHNPQNWLDRPSNDPETRAKQDQFAALVRDVVARRKESESGPDSRSRLIQSHSDVTSKAQRNATEPDDPSASEPIEGGPKTSESPPEPTSSAAFTSSVHISPDLTDEQRSKLLEVLERNQLAFGLDGRLGNYEAQVRIPLKPGTEPISLARSRFHQSIVK
ncbi:hypothetical protein BDZ89DRAFT_967182 [Hymenopellis radicata]|nr:hypothetical protein BDZ89DRAFT_967182 [Hymenopellis radicata]